MHEYILFMHDDAPDRATATDDSAWQSYVSELQASGQFDGGSAIGSGACFRKGAAAIPTSAGANGYFRVRAPSLEAAAAQFLERNPVYLAGGTVEIRLLPRD